MIEMQRAMTGSTLTLEDTDKKNTTLEKPYDDIVERLLDYNEDDVEAEEPDKDEPELEEDLPGLEPAPLELEEITDMHEDLPPTSPDL